MKDGMKTDDDNIVQLGPSYYTMAKEIGDFSELVKKQLPEYDFCVLRLLS
jgi:hypothetical protein